MHSLAEIQQKHIVGCRRRITHFGVPHNVAEWFVSLDDGKFPFCSLLYTIITRNWGLWRSLYPAFQAERRIGQGESASSLKWTALYDILLEWIYPANHNLNKAEVDLDYDQDYFEHTQMIAYADNLATVNGGPCAAYMKQL
jgi:hypothetical protein